MRREELDAIAQSFAKDYEKRVLEHPNSSLNFGWAGLLLYWLSRYLITSSREDLGRVNSLARKTLLGLSSLQRDTSFFLGTLGALWSLMHAEKVLGVKLLKPQNYDAILSAYFKEQNELLSKHTGVLDYIYGLGGWFILFPYLDEKWQGEIANTYRNHFLGLMKDTGKTPPAFFKLTRSGGKAIVASCERFVGFSHGLASALFLIHEYPQLAALKVYSKQLEDWILELFDEHEGLGRSVEHPQDFFRQDWCHGALGGALGLSRCESESSAQLAKSLLDIYSKKFLGNDSFGICHGLGQAYLLQALGKQVFGCNVEVPGRDQFRTRAFSEADFSFINSPLSAAMAAHELDKSNGGFSWWRVVYPLNLTVQQQ